MILDPEAERPPECVRRGVRQGATRRLSSSTTMSCNAVGRRAGRAPGAVATTSRRLSEQAAGKLNSIHRLHVAVSGQVPDPG